MVEVRHSAVSRFSFVLANAHDALSGAVQVHKSHSAEDNGYIIIRHNHAHQKVA